MRGERRISLLCEWEVIDRWDEGRRKEGADEE
jgi:hypothetical protein